MSLGLSFPSANKVPIKTAERCFSVLFDASPCIPGFRPKSLYLYGFQSE